MRLKHILFLAFFLSTVSGFAQDESDLSPAESDTVVTEEKHVIQVSGAIVTNDSLRQVIPNVSVYLEGRMNSTIESGRDGFFSIAAEANDTIVFNHFGFELEKLWVPDTLEGDEYLSIVTLTWRRYQLEVVDIYPWPNKKDLIPALMAMRLPTREIDIANRNLAIQELKERAEEMGYDAAEISDYVMRSQNYNLYNEGRYYGANGGAAILGRLTDPFAWSQFFKALERGDFSN